MHALAQFGPSRMGAGDRFCPKDGPVPVYMPRCPADYAARRMPAPSYMFPFQEAASPLVDICNGDSLVVTGAMTFGNAISGWKQKFVGSSEVASQKAQAPVGHLWNVGCQSLWWYGGFQVTSLASTRYLFDLGGANMFIQMLVNGHLRTVITGHQVDGTIDYRGAVVHPIVIELIGGANMTGHAGAGLYRISTDKEQITNTWVQFDDDVKGIAALAAGIPAVANYGWLHTMTGSRAEALSTAGPKTFLQNFNWAVTGY